MTAPPLLDVRGITVAHGQLTAVREINLTLQPGTIHAVIGANGAGKSTLLRTIAGLHQPSAGSLWLEGSDMTHLAAEKRVVAGVALVPEGRRLFGSLTLEENLQTGEYRARPGRWNVARVYDLFPWMADRRRQQAWQLSGGEQQAVAIGRALITNPKLLLLDELSLGLAPIAVARIYGVLPDLASSGIGVLLVEQDVRQAMRVASRVACLLEGRMTLEGRPDELTIERIEAAYFGLERKSAEHDDHQ